MRILVCMLILLTPVYAITALYNALPSKISLDYGEMRSYPVIVEDTPSAIYKYTIKINGIELDNNGVIKVFLTDREGKLISSEFSNDNLSLSYAVLLDNEVRKVRELYIHIEYYNPISISTKYRVQIEIWPLNQKVYDTTVTSAISYALLYTFDVYANAYIVEPASSTSHSYVSSTSSSSSSSSSYVFTTSYETSYSEIENNSVTKSIDNTTMDKSNNSISSFSPEHMSKEADNDLELNSTRNLINNSFGKDYDYNNLSEMINGSSAGLSSITGRVIQSANSLTVILMILGILALYVLWKKV